MPTDNKQRIKPATISINRATIKKVIQGSIPFESLWELYAAKVYRMAYSYFHCHATAADVQQNVCITLWRKLHQYKGQSAFNSWVYAIAKNHCCMEWRYRATRAWSLLARSEAEWQALIRNCECKTLSPVDLCILKESCQQAIRGVSRLNRTNPLQAAVFFLREAHGMRTKEVAAALKISAPTVKSRYRRATQAFLKLQPQFKELIKRNVVNG